MTIHSNQEQKRSESAPEHPKLILRFICPECGCRDLRTKMLVAHYPVSTLEGLEVHAETSEFEELHQREDPFEWKASSHNEGWEFWCDKCALVPDLEEYEGLQYQEDRLARWLLDNCPQGDDFPHNQSRSSQE
jgi:hypothetical protein